MSRAIGRGMPTTVGQRIVSRRWESNIVMWVGMAVRQAYVIPSVTMRIRSEPSALGGGRFAY